ncbi:hypothetical protein [Nocardia lijiangensis]|uniref:hypothetical protein n=1 Tax=Nocardia lijiangensis TaxID=299618 RepID=UPI003D711336
MNDATPTPFASPDPIQDAATHHPLALSSGQGAVLQALAALIALAEASATTWALAASALVVLAVALPLAGRWRVRGRHRRGGER